MIVVAVLATGIDNDVAALQLDLELIVSKWSSGIDGSSSRVSD